MKRSWTAFLGIPVVLVLLYASAAGAVGGIPETQASNTANHQARDILINAAIDRLAGSYNPQSPYYDGAYAQATKDDFQHLFVAVRRLAQHDDFDQLIVGLDKIMALNDSSDPAGNTLAKYLKQVLKALKPILDPDVLGGLLVALSSVDPAAIGGDTGIVKGLDLTISNNIYGQDRTRSDINTSALRALLIMFAAADYVPTFVVKDKDTGIPYLSMVSSPDHPAGESGTVSGQTHNLAEWAIGEIVTSIRWGREGKIRQNGKYVHLDQFQSFDWLMYKKRYYVSGHGYEALKFEGVISVAADPVAQVLVPASMIEAFPAALDLGGGVKDTRHRGGDEGCMTNTPWRTRYGTAGTRHKLLALASPVLEYFWYARDAKGRSRVRDLVNLVVSLNEIPCGDYRSLDAGDKATFRTNGGQAARSVLKIVEDSGVMNAVIRPHGPDDTGLAVPVLDLLVRVIAKLKVPGSVPDAYRRLRPGFRGVTLLDAVFTEIPLAQAELTRMAGVQGDPIDRLIDGLFLPLPGQTESAATKVEKAAFVAVQAAQDKQFVAAFKTDLNNLADAAEQMAMSADLEKIYQALDTILGLNDNPDPEQNTLARFARKALSGVTVNLDAHDIKGLVLTLAAIDQSAFQGKNGISEGVIELADRNMYGQALDASDIKVCTLRSLLFLLPLRHRIQHLELAGIDTGIALPSLLDSPDHPDGESGTVKGITTDTTEWAIGEIVTAVRWGRAGKIRRDGKPVTLDQFQAFDWVMYKKRYAVRLKGLPVPFVSFHGLAGMLSSPMVPLILPAAVTDVLPSVFELAGGMSDAEYAGGTYGGFTERSWQGRYGTAGRRHKLLALAVPLMEYAWDTKDARGKSLAGDLFQSLEGLNELPLPPAYSPLRGFTGKNSQATLRLDNQAGVLKTVQDSDLLVYLMQVRGEHDVLFPAMNLFGLVVAKLTEKDSGLIYKAEHPGFQGNTLMDALLTELNMNIATARPGKAQDLVDQAIQGLFVPPAGDALNTVARMQNYIHRIVGGVYGNPDGTAGVAKN